MPRYPRHIRDRLDLLTKEWIDASRRLDDADSDEEYDSALVDKLVALLEGSNLQRSMSIRRALSKARAAGKRLGRPPKVTPKDALAAVRKHGSVTAAAGALGVTRWTVRRALATRRKARRPR